MRILAIADHEDKFIWDYFDKTRFENIDLIISCGDLKASYLEFLVTMIPAPLLYVHGNHDTKYTKRPPEGCINIEDSVYIHDSIRILGLGGSIRYKPYATCMYTEQEMEKRIRHRKLKRRIKQTQGFDIMVTHSPPYKIGDGDDPAHVGFQSFIKLMDQYSPRYLLHGHQHRSYNRKMKRVHTYNNTTLINVGPYYILDLETNEHGRNL